MLAWFAGDTKLGGVAHKSEGIWRDLHQAECWAGRNLMRYSKSKHGIVHLGRNNCTHQ